MKSHKIFLNSILPLLLVPGVINANLPSASAANKSCAPEANTIPLYLFHSPSRVDNFTTSDPRWTQNIPQYGNITRSPDYRPKRHEGALYSPHKKQPPGTVPIYSWYSPSRQENFLTSDPRWSVNPNGLTWDATHNYQHLAPKHRITRKGYTLYRMEGYAFDPNKPQPPGTIPLYSLWSEGRKDNFATTLPAYIISPKNLTLDGNRRHIARSYQKEVNVKPGIYRIYRLEGYIVPRLHDRTIHPYYKTCN